MRKGLLVAFLVAGSLAGCGQNEEPATFHDSSPTDPASDAARQLADERARLEQLRVSENGCIGRVLQADVQTAIYGESADRSTAMRNIDMSGCPADFQIAFVEHIQAWEKVIRIDAAIRQLDTGENFGSAVLGEIVGGALGLQTGIIASHIDALATLRRERAVGSQEISDTYEIVTTLARSRGLTVPTA